jgi:hypothetical protein
VTPESPQLDVAPVEYLLASNQPGNSNPAWN